MSPAVEIIRLRKILGDNLYSDKTILASNDAKELFSITEKMRAEKNLLMRFENYHNDFKYSGLRMFYEAVEDLISSNPMPYMSNYAYFDNIVKGGYFIN